MNKKVYVVNAFAETQFGGNPAAVVPLDAWISDGLMQEIASQHNLSETAFVVPHGDIYEIRWFTPGVEVKLCGHATLAAAHVYFNHLGFEKNRIVFGSKSGPLAVIKRADGKLTLDFPADVLVETPDTGIWKQCLHKQPQAIYKSSFDYMVVLENQEDIEALSPDLALLKTLPARGVIITARGKDADFVSRCFYPQSGVDEDPVTGSAHTAMVPYWAKQLGKHQLSAIQLSKRRGYLDCLWQDSRVLMSGHAFTYLEGELFV